MESSGAGVPHLRKIRSFVRREGRLTTGQERALRELWPVWGVEYRPGPVVPAELFGRENAPLTVEIGFGMGASLLEMAAAAPERDFLGIEVHTPGVGACLAGIRARGLANVRIVRHDAVEVFRDMIPDGAADTVQVFFPDPWHKARHHKRRLVNAEFPDLVVPKLKPGGLVHLATDWEDYAEQMLAVLGGDPRLENLAPDGGYAPRPGFRPATKFELRGLRLGHPVRDLMFRKKL